MWTRSPKPSERVLEGRTVLVVDDERDVQEFMAKALSLCGAVVLSAESARQALAFVDAVLPDALVSDLGMPGEDGLWLVAELRKRPHHRGGGLPAIAVTAPEGTYSRAAALAAGFHAYLTKPVEPEALCAGVARVLGTSGRARR